MQAYTARTNNARVGDGMLVIEARREDRATLAARAVANGDEHAIKLTEACLHEHDRNPSPAYLAAARHAIEQTQKRMRVPLGMNLQFGEDRFSSFTGRFANSLFFDLEKPPEGEEWGKVRRGECMVNPKGSGWCAADGREAGKRERVTF